jgi:alanine racemase
MAGDGAAAGGPGPYPAAMEIDLAAVAANLAVVRDRLAGGRAIVAAVKGDAYGHGAAMVARSLARGGVDWLAAGSLRDAEAVRRAGVATPLLLLGPLQAEDIPQVLAGRLVPTLDTEAAAGLLAQAVPAPQPVAVKVDCGFGRFGVPLDRAAAFVRWLAGLPALRLAALYTHLPFADEAGLRWAAARTAAFDGMVDALRRDGLAPPVVQSVASPGLVAGIADRGTAIAAGHLLYGLSPVTGPLAARCAALGLRPAFRGITTRLVHVGHPLPGGAAAGYLQRQDGAVGVVPIGIQDGYRPQPGAAFMMIRGRPAPVLRVCLENTILGLQHCPEAGLGDPVLVAGAASAGEVPLAELAGWQQSSPLALLTAFGRSLPRRYHGA